MVRCLIANLPPCKAAQPFTTMTQRETDNFDAYYDEIADEQYEIWKEQKEIPQLRTIDTTSLQRSIDRMAALLREFDEVTR